jgi:hypothetical protein
MLVRVNNLPAIPDNSYIVRSEIYLCAMDYSTIAMDSLRIQAQALQYNSPIYGYWCLSHTWNNCPPLYSDVIDYNRRQLLIGFLLLECNWRSAQMV